MPKSTYIYIVTSYNCYLTIAVDCGNLTAPVDGTVTHASTTFLSVAEYSCDIGHTLIGGRDTRTCLSNGIWSDSPPSCQSKLAIVL